MDWNQIFDALGGGPSAVGLAGLGFLYWASQKRVNELTDKIIEMSRTQTEAMNTLASRIEQSMRS